MAAAIKGKTGVDVELDPGANGVFDVFVDGALIFSKRKAGRFPFEQEILDKLG